MRTTKLRPSPLMLITGAVLLLSGLTAPYFNLMIGLDKVSQPVQSTGCTLSVNHADRLFSVKVSYKEAL